MYTKAKNLKYAQMKITYVKSSVILCVSKDKNISKWMLTYWRLTLTQVTYLSFISNIYGIFRTTVSGYCLDKQ